jgi:myo-inositol-1(or 4)-monophosphatase
MDLVYVGAGKLDGAVLFDTNMNSLSPGILLAQEAGALYGDFFGNTTGNESKSIVCANPKLFKTILQKLYTYRTRLQP